MPVSLSLNGGHTYYSFNYEGFCTETPEKHRRRGGRKSLSYRMLVSDSAYQEMQDRIVAFDSHRQEFCYTRLGVFFCMLGIPFHWKRHYFCSHFVAEVLSDSGAVLLRKSPVLYRPDDFQRELEGSAQLERMEINPI